MKIVNRVDIALGGGFDQSPEWATACAEVEAAVGAVDWPHGSGSFTVLPERRGNGVVPIKMPCVLHLKSLNWNTELLPPMGSVLQGGGANKTGDLDALKAFNGAYVGFEWETGNISSSHRALNKLVMTMTEGHLKGGILVLPTRAFANYLTDRIGNYEELKPYFPLYGQYPLPTGGAVRVISVEHDATSASAPRIPKGTDGRAKG